MPRLTGEIGFASGYSGYLGSGIAYTSSYIKEADDRGRHPQLPVPRSPRGDVPGAWRGAAPAPAGLSHRHQHPAVHRDRDLRARRAAGGGAGRAQLRARARRRRCTWSRTRRRSPPAASSCRSTSCNAGYPDVFTSVTLAALDGRVAARRRAVGGARRSMAERSPRSAARSALPPRRRTKRSACRLRKSTPKDCG